MKKKINVGIIGRNFGYKVIFQSILKIKSMNVYGFSFKKNKKKINLPKKIKIYSNWKKLISEKKIQAIIISAPPTLHEEMILYAIKKNKHVFCEKPVTNSYKAISKICEKIKYKKTANMVNFEFLNMDAFNFLKTNILNKTKILKVKINWFIQFPKTNRSKWKNRHKHGGGIFYNYLCHPFYYLEKLLGRINIDKNKSTYKNGSSNYYSIFETKKNKVKLFINFKSFFKSTFIRPKHEIIFYTKKGKYILKTKMNSLYDQFSLMKGTKILFKPKKKLEDFRIKPTNLNLRLFRKSIKNNLKISPNFNDAMRVHYLISKISKI